MNPYKKTIIDRFKQKIEDLNFEEFELGKFMFKYSDEDSIVFSEEIINYTISLRTPKGAYLSLFNFQIRDAFQINGIERQISLVVFVTAIEEDTSEFKVIYPLLKEFLYEIINWDNKKKLVTFLNEVDGDFEQKFKFSNEDFVKVHLSEGTGFYMTQISENEKSDLDRFVTSLTSENTVVIKESYNQFTDSMDALVVFNKRRYLFSVGLKNNVTQVTMRKDLLKKGRADYESCEKPLFEWTTMEEMIHRFEHSQNLIKAVNSFKEGDDVLSFKELFSIVLKAFKTNETYSDFFKEQPFIESWKEEIDLSEAEAYFEQKNERGVSKIMCLLSDLRKTNRTFFDRFEVHKDSESEGGSMLTIHTMSNEKIIVEFRGKRVARKDSELAKDKGFSMLIRYSKEEPTIRLEQEIVGIKIIKSKGEELNGI